MVENKEIKIAIVVGIIMVTLCLLIFIVTSSKKTTNNIVLKVYKLYDKEGTVDEHEYRSCKVSTDDLIYINQEYKKIQKVTDDSRILGKQINGNYKIIVGDDSNYIAFDALDDPYIYRSDKGAIYEFKTDLYDTIKKICN